MLEAMEENQQIHRAVVIALLVAAMAPLLAAGLADCDSTTVGAIIVGGPALAGLLTLAAVLSYHPARGRRAPAAAYVAAFLLASFVAVALFVLAVSIGLGRCGFDVYW